MHPVLSKTFGGLSPQYYFRHFIFGLAIAAFMGFMTFQNPQPVSLGLVGFLIVNTLLYPYARFVYESVVSFIIGQNVFFLNALVMLFFKVLTIVLCWVLAIFVAPVGLAYLYFHHSKASGGVES